MIRPLIIGHRGASGDAPENTLASFRLAAAQGADGIEFDVFQTTDKEIVVTHDENLKRITGHDVWTRRLTLKELRELDFGKGEKIPTMEEVLSEVGSLFSVLNIEIKSTGMFTDGIEQILIDRIKKYHMEEKVLVSSFNPLHILRIKRLAPFIRTGYLISPRHWTARRKIFIRHSGAVSINVDHEWLSDRLLEVYRTMGKLIWVWTVNEEEDIKRWISKPVSAIITNYPGRLKQLLEGKRVAMKIPPC